VPPLPVRHQLSYICLLRLFDCGQKYPIDLTGQRCLIPVGYRPNFGQEQYAKPMSEKGQNRMSMSYHLSLRYSNPRLPVSSQSCTDSSLHPTKIPWAVRALARAWLHLSRESSGILSPTVPRATTASSIPRYASSKTENKWSDTTRNDKSLLRS